MVPKDDNGRVNWLRDDLADIKRRLDNFVALYGETRETQGRHDVRLTMVEGRVSRLSGRFNKFAVAIILLLIGAIIGGYVK